MTKHFLPVDAKSIDTADTKMQRMCDALVARLTNQEKSIYYELLHGMKRRVIAEKMAISPRTYDAHRANLMRKASTTMEQQTAS